MRAAARAGLGGAGLTLVGCGSDDDGGGSGNAAPGTAADAAIAGFLGERVAAAMATSSQEVVLEAALADLATMFGPAALLPARVLWQVWHDTSWVRGGYSDVRVGQQGAREALAAPLAQRPFFAGEATHPTTPATTHGAIESGRRAAAELLAARS